MHKSKKHKSQAETSLKMGGERLGFLETLSRAMEDENDPTLED